jgi:hypothetical protein
MKTVNCIKFKVHAVAIGCLLSLPAITGCAARSSCRNVAIHTEHDAALAPGEPQIERGRPAPVVDTVGQVVGIPAKIIMLDHRVSNHNVSPQTEAAVGKYLADNGLDKVKVRVNEYDPGGEWQRLRENQSVSWPIRYSLGTLSLVGYTLLPGRVFGGDHYNPYTNSVYIYSDIPALGMYEGGYAKDFATKEDRDLYATTYAIPLVNVWHAKEAADESLDYLASHGSPQDVKEGYRAICPAFAATITPLPTVGSVPMALPVIATGHAVGQVQAARVEDAPIQQVSSPPPQEYRPVEAAQPMNYR